MMSYDRAENINITDGVESGNNCIKQELNEMNDDIDKAWFSENFSPTCYSDLNTNEKGSVIKDQLIDENDKVCSREEILSYCFSNSIKIEASEDLKTDEKDIDIKDQLIDENGKVWSREEFLSYCHSNIVKMEKSEDLGTNTDSICIKDEIIDKNSTIWLEDEILCAWKSHNVKLDKNSSSQEIHQTNLKSFNLDKSTKHLCGDRFSWNADNEDSLHWIKEKYNCDLCDYNVLCTSLLLDHILLVHLKERKHIKSAGFEDRKQKCDLCQRRFSARCNLQTHMKTVHLKERAFKCSNCQCSFTKQSILQMHIKSVHLRARNHECDFCPYRSFAKSTLFSDDFKKSKNYSTAIKHELYTSKYESTKDTNREEQIITIEDTNSFHYSEEENNFSEAKDNDAETEFDNSDQRNKDQNFDKVIFNFGNSVNESDDNVETFSNLKPWTKKNACPYCFNQVTHFPRHLIRNHKDRVEVQELMSLSVKNPRRKELIKIIRRQGNFISKSFNNTIRPIRRPKDQRIEIENMNRDIDNYVACPDCLGYFKRNFLRRHRKVCSSKRKTVNSREQHLSSSQLFSVCVGSLGEFHSTLRLKTEVFPFMKNDIVSKQAMKDVLICLYADDQLKKHKCSQIKNPISNKMRELGRLLLTLKKMTEIQRLFDTLTPRFFDMFVAATKIVSGYSDITRTFKSASLALHIGTILKQVCDFAMQMVVKENPLFPCENRDETLKNIELLSQLIKNTWNSKVSSLALEGLNEKPKLLPLTEEVEKFQKFLYKEAEEACNAIKENRQLESNFRRLSECILAITLLLNGKRIGEIQSLTCQVYYQSCSANQQEEFLNSLSKVEKSLVKKFKTILTKGKGSKPIAILFSKEVQDFIEVLFSVRVICVSERNQYLFANPNTNSGCLSGYHTIKKLSEEAGVFNKILFATTRLRKHISAILQVINIKEDEMEQFANFMGHTKKTHESFYRLPHDILQTAKLSKILLAINNGNIQKYKGKTFDEIDVDTDLDDLDSDEESGIEKNVCIEDTVQKKLKKQKSVENKSKKHTDGNGELQGIVKNQQQFAERNKIYSDPKKSVVMKNLATKRWTSDERMLMKEYFKDHIKNKRAPKKSEVVGFMNKNKQIGATNNWTRIKAFVYNSYK